MWEKCRNISCISPIGWKTLPCLGRDCFRKTHSDLFLGFVNWQRDASRRLPHRAGGNDRAAKTSKNNFKILVNGSRIIHNFIFPTTHVISFLISM